MVEFGVATFLNCICCGCDCGGGGGWTLCCNGCGCGCGRNCCGCSADAADTGGCWIMGGNLFGITPGADVPLNCGGLFCMACVGCSMGGAKFGATAFADMPVLYPGIVGDGCDCVELPFVNRCIWVWGEYGGCALGLGKPFPLLKWTFCRFDVIRSRFSVFGAVGAADVATAGFAIDAEG